MALPKFTLAKIISVVAQAMEVTEEKVIIEAHGNRNKLKTADFTVNDRTVEFRVRDEEAIIWTEQRKGSGVDTGIASYNATSEKWEYNTPLASFIIP